MLYLWAWRKNTMQSLWSSMPLYMLLLLVSKSSRLLEGPERGLNLKHWRKLHWAGLLLHSFLDLPGVNSLGTNYFHTHAEMPTLCKMDPILTRCKNDPIQFKAAILRTISFNEATLCSWNERKIWMQGWFSGSKSLYPHCQWACQRTLRR